MDHQPTRRRAIAEMGALLSLICLGAGGRAAAATALADWVRRAEALSAGLRGGTLDVAAWRHGLDAAFAHVAVEDVARAIDFDRLAGKTGFADLGVATASVRFPEATRRLAFHAKLFAIGKGRAVIPHGHANMVSAHLPLRGRLRLRQYDQVGRDDGALLIRPAGDRRIGPGDLSSIGDAIDNVHWFVAEEPAYTLDLIVTGLDPAAERRYDIFNIDIDRATPAGDGLLRAPRMDVAAALAKYG